MTSIGVDVQQMLLLFGQTRFPVAFHAVPVRLLALSIGHVLFFARSQAVVLAIVPSAGWQDVLADVARRPGFHISRYDLLPAQELPPKLADGRLVHSQRSFAPDFTTRPEVEPLRHDTGTAFVSNVRTALPMGRRFAGHRFVPSRLVVATFATGDRLVISAMVRPAGVATRPGRTSGVARDAGFSARFVLVVTGVVFVAGAMAARRMTARTTLAGRGPLLRAGKRSAGRRSGADGAGHSATTPAADAARFADFMGSAVVAFALFVEFPVLVMHVGSTGALRHFGHFSKISVGASSVLASIYADALSGF